MTTRTAKAGLLSRRMIIAMVAMGIIALALGYFVHPAYATQPDPHKVTICHRTNSVTNPYVKIDVDVASVNGDNQDEPGGKGDHLLEHLGPVFDFTNPPPPPHNGDQWGDIIPPFFSDGVTPTPGNPSPSLNWPAGEALFESGCQIPGESPDESVPESEAESESESESAEQSVEGSGEESDEESGEQSVEAGTGTPEETAPDGALSLNGVGALPTIAFSLILLASLGALAYANVKSVRS